MSYEFSGVRVKGSELGRAYTAQGLCQKKAISYDPARDDSKLRGLAASDRPIPSEVRPRGPEHPDRIGIDLSYAEEQVLWEAGRFRIVAEPDLARSHYSGDYGNLQQDLRRLASFGLIERHKISTDGRGRTLAVVSLTRSGKAYLKNAPSSERDGQQAIFVGIVKPREVTHDSAIYRMYLAEAGKIEAQGGRVRRVVLDYELKQKAYSPLAKAVDLPPLEYAERQQEIAAENNLSVVDGHIVLPDLRIEYETPDGELRHLDLELATRNYRAAHVSAKASAGFKVYADTSSGRLSAVLDDHHLVAELLRI
jgi:DNA-binding PadR family transcriptional regulator